MSEFILKNDLTFTTIQREQAKLLGFIKNTSKSEPLTINLAEVSRSDSAGLALIIAALRLSIDLKKVILFKSIPEQMLSMMRFCDILPLFEKNLI